MVDHYNEHYRSQRQRRYFPVKFSEDLRREICLKLALGESVASIHAWVTEERHITCSYNAIRHYLITRRWKRFIETITRIELYNPEYTVMHFRMAESRQNRFVELEKIFFECMNLAVSKNPQQAEDFAKAARILRRMREKPAMRIISKLNRC